jgi:prolyl-tRNA synthetase
MAEDEGITVKKSENFSEWYIQAIIKSEFFDYGDISGTTIFRPDGYFIW